MMNNKDLCRRADIIKSPEETPLHIPGYEEY